MDLLVTCVLVCAALLGLALLERLSSERGARERDEDALIRLR